MANVKELTKQNFDKEVLNAEGGSVLVDFWAPWCGPCRMQGPVVEKLAEGGYSVAKVNIDEQPELAEQYRVMSIPTLIVFKNGKVEDQMVAYSPIRLWKRHCRSRIREVQKAECV